MLWTAPVSLLRTSMRAPTMIAPEGSVMVPEIAAVFTWARAEEAQSMLKKASKAKCHRTSNGRNDLFNGVDPRSVDVFANDHE
jgi:hypothetical protein